MGNALGESLAYGSVSGGNTPQESFRQSEIRQMNADAAAELGGSGLRLSRGAADSWGPQYRFDDEPLPVDYGLAGNGARLGGSSHATVASGDTLGGITGGDKEMMGRYIAGMGLRNPNNLRAGQSLVANWNMSADEAVALANRFYTADAQAKAAAAQYAASRSAQAPTDPLANAYATASSYPAYAREIGVYEQLRSSGAIDDDKFRELVLGSRRATMTLRSDYEEVPPAMAYNGPGLRPWTPPSRVATGGDLGVRAGTFQFQVAQQLPEAMLVVGAPELIPARVAGMLGRATTAVEGLVFGERSVLMSSLQAEMRAGLQTDLLATAGLAPETRSILSQSAIRARVEANIADSQAARASSNFGQFIKAEGRLQADLGIWPPNSGGYAPTYGVGLDVGMRIDRYGYPGGKFVSPLGETFESRALPPLYETTKPYFQYEVVQPITDVTQAKALPWFGQRGMGTQYQLSNSVQWYLDNGYLKVIPK
jgi:hypothetical protein